MRDQIITGIINAMQASQVLGSDLCCLTEGDQDLLVNHLLESLAEVPEGTPAPVVTEVAAGPALVISPAEVVAMLATTAYSEVTRDRHTGLGQTYTDAMWSHPENNKEIREFLFAVQRLFGVRVRSVVVDHVGGTFIVAGLPSQITALNEVYDRFLRAAQPVTATMTSAQRREFWATLGALVTDPAHSDRVEHLTDTNRDLADEATAYLNRTYGTARRLTRTNPAADGEVYEQAASVLATHPA